MSCPSGARRNGLLDAASIVSAEIDKRYRAGAMEGRTIDKMDAEEPMATLYSVQRAIMEKVGHGTPVPLYVVTSESGMVLYEGEDPAEAMTAMEYDAD